MPPEHRYSHPSVVLLATRYLDIVESLKTPTGVSAIKSHLFRLLKPVLDTDPDEKLRIMISKCRMTPGDRLADFREVVHEVELRCEVSYIFVIIPKAKLGSSRSMKLVHHGNHRRLMHQADTDHCPASLLSPMFDQLRSLQKHPPLDYCLKRSLRMATWVEYLLGRDVNSISPICSWTRTDANAVAESDSSAVNTNLSAKCSHTGHIPCGGIAAIRCPNRACLIHCRQIQATASGMDVLHAAQQAEGGGLMGVGCEGHEAKAAAKKERFADKRKTRSEWKQVVKMRKLEGKKQARLDAAAEEGYVGVAG